MKNYNIQVVSDICGITDHTLRAWERRYGVVEPERSSGGQRQYTQEDLDKLQLLSFLVARGHRISKLAKMPPNELQELYNMSSDQWNEGSTKASDKKLTHILALLSKYKLDDLYFELVQLKQELGDLPFIECILLPLFRDVGDKVLMGDFSVSQEHAISALARDLLSQIQLTPPKPHAPKIVLTSPEGNLHELGLLMANVYCRHYRTQTHFFGVNLPAQPLAEAINSINADYVILGTTYSSHWNEKDLLMFLQKLDIFLKTDIKVFLSGLHQEIPDLRLANIQVGYFKTFSHLKSWLIEKVRPQF